MNKKILCVLLFLIVVLASVLRLWQLGNVPPSPDWDEAALGYDAYSILHTGRDEFGKFLPVVLRSFDDYKPALYAYLTIPAVIIFGLSTFSVRFPSAIFGIIGVIAVFFLIRELFKDFKYKDPLSLIASFFYAISPWSIQFSRVGFESNVGGVLNILAALFFVKAFKKPWVLSLSFVFAALSIYVYQSEKVFTPLLILAMCLIYKRELLKINRKYIFMSISIGFIVILPMLYYLVTDKSALLRAKGTSIFNYQTEILKQDIGKIERDKANNDKVGLILDNRRVVFLNSIIEGYISHFSPNWLFINGDISRHHAPNMGLLYLFEFPLILLGIYFLVFGKYDRKAKILIISWFLLAPVPASITTGVPHAVRTLNFLPTWQIFAALGLVETFIILSRSKYKILSIKIWKLIAIIYFIFATFNFAYYLDQYFIQLNYFDSSEWQYGYKQAVDIVNTIGYKYKKVVVSDNQPLDKSYMFFLFYLKYPPREYQKVGERSSGSFVSHHFFGKYEFRPINWSLDSNQKGILYIGNPTEIPEQSAFKTINNLNGTPAIRIAGT